MQTLSSSRLCGLILFTFASLAPFRGYEATSQSLSRPRTPVILAPMSEPPHQCPETPGLADETAFPAALEAPAEENERRWLTEVYAGRGDTQKQLTLRAVLMGGV